MKYVRLRIFEENLRKIQKHNEKFNRGESSYKMGVNKFTDMTTEEFRNMLGFKPQARPAFDVAEITYNGTIPEFVNWTSAGAVTDAKDQGNCGACWSFSAVGCLEGQYFLKTKKLLTFSAQYLVDCDDTCKGCQGGLMARAFDYIIANGIVTEKEYPYKGINEACVANRSSAVYKISSYKAVKENDEEALKVAVASVGPISVGIDASDNFRHYSSGVLNDSDCGNGLFDLNHGVLVTGYGTENGKDYWIIKNSWGQSWGENGFVKLARNEDNQCGIGQIPNYPLL